MLAGRAAVVANPVAVGERVDLLEIAQRVAVCRSTHALRVDCNEQWPS